jgi:nicotinamide-nucleotide amidase
LEQERNGILETTVLKLYGISESQVDEELKGWMTESSNPTVAPYAGEGEVEIHITAFSDCHEEALRLCRERESIVLSKLGIFCYEQGEERLEDVLVNRVRRQGITVATAESCTGGLVSARISSVSGASAVLKLGICAYTEEQKRKVLGVREDTLSCYGVYSKECALEMARGARLLANSQVGIGVTGIAGPGGATEQDPVGCVYLAAVNGKTELAERVVFGTVASDRNQIRSLAASKALAMALELETLFQKQE